MFWNVVGKGKLLILRPEKTQTTDLEMRAQKAHIYCSLSEKEDTGKSKLLQETKNKINVILMIKAS